MKYDDANWHYGGDFPADQPIEHGGTHIALFLKWCFSRGWAGKYYGDNGLYLQDYVEHFGDQMYVAPESAHDFARFSTMLNCRPLSGVLEKANNA